MHSNLDHIAEEIRQYMAAEHFLVFRCASRALDERHTVYWDITLSADYKAFLDCSLQLGVRLIHFHVREFRAQHREEALSLLEAAGLAREEKRNLERRIGELAIYEGFTCAVELSFDFENRAYLFELQTDWYEEWNEMMDEMEDAADTGEEADPGSFGGFYSRN
jgi:hypothetical protein